MGYDVFDKLCKAKGVTAYQVAKETGVSTATLSSWKNGRYVPKDEKLQKLADFFGVSPYYLRTGKELIKIPIHRPDYRAIERLAFDSEEEYYSYKESQVITQEIFDDPDLRALFYAARGCKSEDLKMARDLLKRLKGTNPDG